LNRFGTVFREFEDRTARSSAATTRRIGECLLDRGTIREKHIQSALREQARTGGRLGEILFSRGLVDGTELGVALADHYNLPSLVAEYEAVPRLPRDAAHQLRAAVLAGPTAGTGDAAILVAVTDLSVVPRVALLLGQPVEPRLADDQKMDELLADAYAHADGTAAALALRRGPPRRLLEFLGRSAAACAALAVALYTYLHPVAMLSIGVAGLGVYWLVLARFALGRKRPDSVANAAPVAATPDDRVGLPLCTVLAPLVRESPSSLRRLRDRLEGLEYPHHRLQGLALVDATDRATRRSLRSEPLPPWVTALVVPREAAHGRRGRLLYGLLQTRGERVAVADGNGELAPHTFALSAPPWLMDALAGTPSRFRRWMGRHPWQVELFYFCRRRQLAGRFLRQADISWHSGLVLAAGGQLRRDPGGFWTHELLAAFDWQVPLDHTPS